MSRVNNWFQRFAERMQTVIASPIHFAVFWLAIASWFCWAAFQHFSATAQLAVNAPTTIFEYAFEVLILAAALRASQNSDKILSELRSLVRKMLDEEEHVEKIAKAVAEKLGVADDEK